MTVGLPALALASSCVPGPPKSAPQPSAAQRQEADGRALLRQLDLHVPDGGVNAPLPLAVTAKPSAPPPFVVATSTVEDAARAGDCLTAAVYYEARSEPDDGQRAVAQVVLNRVRDRAFPNSVCGVVYQGSTRRTGCQFSFTCDGSMDRPRDPVAWEHARTIATAALTGSVYAPVGAATFYHAYTVLPWWASSLTRIGSIGAHIFYGWSGALERALSFRQAYAGVEPIAGAGFAPSLEVAGVQVHRGADSGYGVTVHRGGEVPVAADVAPDDRTDAQAMAGGERSAIYVRGGSIPGVRVHVGAGAGPTLADSMSENREARVSDPFGVSASPSVPSS